MTDEERHADRFAELNEAWRSETRDESVQEPMSLGTGRVYAADPATGDWSEMGVTTGPVEVRPDSKSWAKEILHTLKAHEQAEAAANVTIGPVDEPHGIVPKDWIQEAIDRASTDRTPVLETKIDVSPAVHRFSEAVKTAQEALTSWVTPATGDQTHAAWKHEMLEQIYGPIASQRRQVALLGTGKRRHAVPRWRGEDETWASYARRRRLYSERLRRDRRRIRKGRAPILRSSTFEMVIPKAQIKVTKAGPEYYGMEVVAHPWVPEDQVWLIDPALLDGYRFTEPKTFDWSDAERRAARYRDQAAMYGYGMSPTGRFRTTNYFAQMLHTERQGWRYKPSRAWVDETADWAPEHGPDEDRWLNEGGADRG